MAGGMPRHGINTDFNKAMEGLRFPASRAELVEQARARQMDDQVIEVLEHMPERQFFSADDIVGGLGDNG